MIILQAFSMRDGGEEGRQGAKPGLTPRLASLSQHQLPELTRGGAGIKSAFGERCDFPQLDPCRLLSGFQKLGTAVQATNIPAGSLHKLPL